MIAFKEKMRLSDLTICIEVLTCLRFVSYLAGAVYLFARMTSYPAGHRQSTGDVHVQLTLDVTDVRSLSATEDVSIPCIPTQQVKRKLCYME